MGNSSASLFRHDRSLGQRWVAGCDEAGRGCLAGPLVGAAVLLDYENLSRREVRDLRDLGDSKKKSPARREALYPLVVRSATRVCVSVRSPRYIDQHGIQPANLGALAQSLTAAAGQLSPVALLVDGFELPIPAEHHKLIKGDDRSAAIAAASIVAKVVRDRYMTRASEVHDKWDFERHMGYGTAAHLQAIRNHGFSPLHRRSFKSI